LPDHFKDRGPLQGADRYTKDSLVLQMKIAALIASEIGIPVLC
jgi:hypothetical protein